MDSQIRLDQITYVHVIDRSRDALNLCCAATLTAGWQSPLTSTIPPAETTMLNALKVSTRSSEKLPIDDSEHITRPISSHSQGYAPLPTGPGQSRSDTDLLEWELERKEKRHWFWPLIATLLALLCLPILWSSNHFCRTTKSTYRFPSNKDYSWAAYNPYFPVEGYRPPPIGCQIDQVRLIIVHVLRSHFYSSRLTLQVLL